MIKLMLKTKKSKKEFYSYYDKSEEIPRFGCIKFNKGQKSELKMGKNIIFKLLIVLLMIRLMKENLEPLKNQIIVVKRY